jgi:hypothetical protein
MLIAIDIDINQLDSAPRLVPGHRDHGGGDFRAVNDPPWLSL